MQNIKSLCVFCGSRLGESPAFETAAIELGREMASRGVRLVYGGGRIGLMGCVADAVLEAGGDVVGVIPTFLEEKEVAHGELSELIVTDTMHSRKQKMFELAEGFISLPGGLGTLDETFEIMTWKQLKQHDKPVIMLNVENYWQPFVALVEANIAGGFASPAARGLFRVASSVENIFEILEAAPEPTMGATLHHL